MRHTGPNSLSRATRDIAGNDALQELEVTRYCRSHLLTLCSIILRMSVVSYGVVAPVITLSNLLTNRRRIEVHGLSAPRVVLDQKRLALPSYQHAFSGPAISGKPPSTDKHRHLAGEGYWQIVLQKSALAGVDLRRRLQAWQSCGGAIRSMFRWSSWYPSRTCLVLSDGCVAKPAGGELMADARTVKGGAYPKLPAAIGSTCSI